MAKRILVVEDNDLNRKLFCDVLRGKGYEVLGCSDGNTVIEAARRFRPDLAIMDIQLPHVSGLDLIAQMKADPQLSAVPVLLAPGAQVAAPAPAWQCRAWSRPHARVTVG